MRKELKEKTDLFISNKKTIKKVLRFDNENTYLLGSMLYTIEGKTIDENKIKEASKIFKEKVSLFSDFRFLSGSVIVRMSLEKNPKTYLERLLKIYDKMNTGMFSSIYKIVAAILMCDNNKDKDIDALIEKYNTIFQDMKEKHPIITTSSDIPFAVLLSLSDRKEKEIIKDVNECYELLTERFSNKNEVQSLSHILALSDVKSKEKVDRVFEIYDLLKENKRKCSNSYNFQFLGILAILGKNVNDIVNDVIEIDNYLGCQKGLGLWPFGKATRLFFSSFIVANVNGNSMNGSKTAILTSTLTNLVVEEILSTILIMNIILLDD